MTLDDRKKRQANLHRSRVMRDRAASEPEWGQSKVALSDLEMAAMLHGGSTLEEIATVAGVTRERVRQRLERIGVTPATRLDVLKLVEIVRTQPITSFAALANAANIGLDNAHIAMFKLGLSDAVERLFRLRKRAKDRAQDAAVLVALGEYAYLLGRTPTAKDLVRRDRPANVPSMSGLQKQFGSISEAMRAAGLPPNRSGRPRGASSRQPKT